MRIRTKLQIAFFTTASIVAVSILSVSYFSMLTHFEQQEGKRLKLNVVHSAKAIDYFMFNRVADFNVLSNNPLFSTSSNDIISDYLLRVVNQYPFYEDLFFVNKNGIILSSSNKELIGANMLQLEPDIEDEFNKTISGGPNDVFISDVTNISQKEIEENAVLDLELLSDVIDLNENVVGVLVGSINIQILSELIFEIDDKIFDNENTYLVNDKGIVLISGNKEVEILQQHPDLFLKELQQKIENRENGFYIYKNSIDIKVISGYADLSKYGAERVGNWSLLSITPYNQVMQPIYNMIYKALYIFLFIILCIFVLLIIFSGTFSKPIVELEKAVSDFGISGKPLNLKSTHKDEIGSLYESFNIMTENLYELSKKRDRAEHKLISAKARAEESENHLRTILETEPECIKQLDAKGELIYMNPAGLAMIEADNLAMVKGQPMIGLITRNHQRAFKKLTNEVFNGKSGQLKFEIKGIKGTTRWLETHAVPFKDTEGNIISLLGVTRDITSEKRAEILVIESENKYRQLFENMNTGFVLFEVVLDANKKPIDLIIKAANKEFELTTSLQLEKVIEKHLTQVLPGIENDEANWIGTFGNIAINGGNCHFDDASEILGKHYTIHAYHSGPNQCAVTFIDITLRIYSQQVIKENEANLSSLINNTNDYIWSIDRNYYFIIFNKAYADIFLLVNKFEIKKGMNALKILPAEELEFWKGMYKPVFGGEIKVFEFNQNIDGKRHYFQTTINPIYEDGLVTGASAISIDITNIKKTEEALKHSEERMRLSTELANVAVWEYNFVTNSMERSANHDALYGIVNQGKWEMETFLEATHPDDRKISEAYIIKSKAKGGPDTYQFDFRVVYPNKSIHWLTVLGHVIERNADGIALSLRGTLIDITQRKKAEEEIRSAHQRLTTHLNNSPLAVIEWDKNFIIRNWSVQAKNIFGWEESEAVGKHFNDLNLVYEGDAAATAIIAEDLMLGKVKSNRNINRNYTKSKKVIYCEWYNSVLQSADGEIETIFSLVQDVTDRKKAEVELEKYRNNLEGLVELRTNQLEKEKIKAQSADLMKSAFLATMSHELRTPMNSIIGFTGILLKELAGPLNNEQRRQLGMVKNSGQHLLGLINDVLDISKIEAGRLKVSIYYFNYLTTLEKTIDFLLPQAAKKELQICSEISELNIILNSDERRVEQVLLNLISNAIKFSNHGTITIKVDIVDGLVVTQVIDQGIGMSKKDLNKLFMPFIQLDGGLSRTHEGTGLGLAICKSLIEKLGGTIQVESKVGKGSNFTFTLPIEYVEKG